MVRKQTVIPGTERKTHKDIDEAASLYVKARDARMKLTKKEVETRTILVEAMRRHGVESYTLDELDMVATLEVNEKLSVRKTAEAGDD